MRAPSQPSRHCRSAWSPCQQQPSHVHILRRDWTSGAVDFTCFRHRRASSSRSLLHIVLWRRQNRRFRHFTVQPAMLSRSCTLSDECKPRHPIQRLQPRWPRGCSGVTAVRVSPSSSWTAVFKCSLQLQQWKNKSEPKFGQNCGSWSAAESLEQLH